MEEKEEYPTMGALKDLDIELRYLVQESALWQQEAEDLREDLATEINDHVNCHKVFDEVARFLNDELGTVAEERDYWERSFNELAAHTVELQRQLAETKNQAYVAEYLLDQQEGALNDLGVQVVAFADFKAEVFDAFASGLAERDALLIGEDILSAAFNHAPDLFDLIEFEIRRHEEAAA